MTIIGRIVLAAAVLIVVGLVLVYLVGPLLVATGIPFVVIVGDFFVRWGWLLALAAAIWQFFSGQSWPLRRP